MTEHTDTDGTAAGDAREDDAPKTLGELSHTNPFTNEAFGATQTYDRGRTIAADGGSDPEREAESESTDGEAVADGGEAGGRASSDASDGGEAEDDADPEELQDIEHTPPGDAEGTNDVYERGHEGREENR